MKKLLFIIVGLMLILPLPQTSLAKRSITKPSTLAVYHNNRGVKYLNAGELKLAETEFKTAAELSPDYPEAYNNLGIVAKKLGDLQNAKTYFRKAIELDKNYGSAYSHLSMVYLDMGDLSNALSFGKIAIIRGSTLPLTHFNLGLVYIAKDREKPGGKFAQKAEQQIKIATELDPGMYEGHLALAKLYGRQGRYELSAIRYRLALEQKPHNPKIWNELANVYKQMGQYTKAENAMRKAASLQGGAPQPKTPQMQQVIQLISKKQYSKAIALLKQIIQNEKNNEWAYYRLGTSYLYLGEVQLSQNKKTEATKYFNSANTYLQKALQINSQLADASYNLGYTHLRLGNAKTAEGHWNKTLSINPNHERTLYNLGMLYNHQGDKQKANAFLCKFVAVAGPNFASEKNNALSIVSANGGKCQN